jgi:hypothetical protein
MSASKKIFLSVKPIQPGMKVRIDGLDRTWIVVEITRAARVKVVAEDDQTMSRSVTSTVCNII